MEQIVKDYEKVQAKLAMINGRTCDKYDYMIATFCGLISGMIDVVFVGKPGDSILGVKIDEGADALVKKVSQILWKADKRSPSDGRNNKMPETLQQCIQYLERAFPVPYDASSNYYIEAPQGTLSGMRPINHHILSLAHSPDIIGLLFSLVDQFTDMGSYIDKGKLIRVKRSPYKQKIPLLQGNDFISKVYCGVFNWLGHIISDLVGANTTRADGKSGRGSGVGLPFYELFLLFDNTLMGGEDGGQSVADVAIKVFENGYDLRFGATMTIPVMVNELSIQLIWALKGRFYHKRLWKECIPSSKHADLRCMLLVGETTLCVIDAIDATIQSKGNVVDFLLHVNIVAWYKLVKRIFAEIMIRYSFTYEDMRIQFEYINYQLTQYLEKLRAIDYSLYQKELKILEETNTLLQLEDYNNMPKRLQEICVENHIQLPWRSSEEAEKILFSNEKVEF